MCQKQHSLVYEIFCGLDYQHCKLLLRGFKLPSTSVKKKWDSTSQLTLEALFCSVTTEEKWQLMIDHSLAWYILSKGGFYWERHLYFNINRNKMERVIMYLTIIQIEFHLFIYFQFICFVILVLKWNPQHWLTNWQTHSYLSLGNIFQFPTMRLPIKLSYFN